MKKLLSFLALGLMLSLGSAHAATDQQNKMKMCNEQAKDKKGDERKAFMKECLSAKPAAAPEGTPQQNKMKMCNDSAKDLKGEERKKHMSACLKNK
ncbi:MAG: PsiF family protein [Rhodoferax sp.]